MRPASSSNTRRARTFAASRSAVAVWSPWVIPSRTSRPGPIAAIGSPDTVTDARLTRCTSARMAAIVPGGVVIVPGASDHCGQTRLATSTATTAAAVDQAIAAEMTRRSSP